MFVRTAKEGDLDALYALCCEQAAHALPQEIFSAIFSAALHDNRRRLVVAVEDAQIVGYADLMLELPLSRCSMSAVLLDLYVTAPQRGRGIGTGLLIALFRQAQSLGCGELAASCQRVNVRGREFLERQGFVLSRHSFTRPLGDGTKNK